MNNYLINNAEIVLTDRILKGSLLIRDGIIEALYEADEKPVLTGKEELIDAQGKLLMPGIIDIHTDAMDKEIVPRPGADFPLRVAFRELEHKMCACGITTVYHSLHIGYLSAENSARSKYQRLEIINAVHENALAGGNLIRNYIHLRYELTGVDVYQEVFSLLVSGKVQLFSIMDHTPGQGQYPDFNPFLKQLETKGFSREEASAELKKRLAYPKINDSQVRDVVKFAIKHKIPTASHDDDSPDRVRFHQEMGIHIIEFPINEETARFARTQGLEVAGGGSNILRGGSLSGNLNILAAVMAGDVNIVCSDYYPPSILHSVFTLVEQGMPLTNAVRLVSLNPARAVGIDHFTGSIREGLVADLILVDFVHDYPVVASSWVDGCLVHQSFHRHKMQLI